MAVNSQFYEKLHANDQSYGKASFNLKSLNSSSPFRTWQKRRGTHPIRLLDVGCGKGQFLFDITRHFESNLGIPIDRVVGLDLIKASPNLHAEISPRFEFIQQSVDGVALPFPDSSFDFISCNHVLEHVFATEALVREFHRVIDSAGFCLIGVPNIAAWMNRIAFLFGGQPLGSEVGTETVTYGFWPGFLKERLKKFPPSGHIRDFTPRSLKDLTHACGFNHVGWWAQDGEAIGRLNPKLVRNLAILLEPAKVSSQ